MMARGLTMYQGETLREDRGVWRDFAHREAVWVDGPVVVKG